MIDFYLKKGDLVPILSVALQDADGEVVDLTDASIRFNYQLRYPEGDIVSRTPVIYDADNGIVEYYWEAADTATPGVYNGEFVVTFSDSTEMTFPSRGPFVFEILDDIS